MGMLNDLQNSLVRYYKNNFSDGFRQDAIDLFLGNYRIEDNPGEFSFWFFSFFSVCNSTSP